MIRAATLDDLDHIIRLGREMHAESRYSRLNFDGARLAMTASRLIVEENGFLVVGERNNEVCAMMLAQISEHWFTADRIAFEYGVFVAPAHRGSMLAFGMIRRFVEWGKSNGARLIELGITTGVTTERSGRFYERMGFEPVGAVYSMEV